MNKQLPNIFVVIPYYNASKHIESVVSKLPDYLKGVIIVDDQSKEALPDVFSSHELVTIVTNEKNLGVGGATIHGFKVALELGADIVIKLDADDQMDSSYLPDLIQPIVDGKCEMAKGNRFRDFDALKKMPFGRRFGNLVLSFLTKTATGYWNNFDPTNGFFAISGKALKKITFSNLSERYFFETSLLAELYNQNARIKDVGMPAIYGDEKSSMRVWQMPFVFIPKLFSSFVKRIFKTYFIYDFNVCSLYLLLGVPLFLFGIVYGSYIWWYYASNEILTPTGTIMIITLSIILGFQLLLQAIQYDILKAPKAE